VTQWRSSNVAVVMAFLFVRLDGEEWAARILVWWRFGKGSSQIAFGKSDSWTMYRAWHEWFSRRKLSVLTPTAAMPVGVVTPWGIVVRTFPALGLRVKTLDRLGLDDGGTLRRYPLEGIIAALRYLSVSIRCLRWQVMVFPIFFLVYLDLLCKRISSPLYIGTTTSGNRGISTGC
jgi:hypothetical protein